MTAEHKIRQYRRWYARLLCLYSKPHYERFGEGMEQTFNDLIRERERKTSTLFAFVMWMFVDTFWSITKENANFMLRQHKTIIDIILGTALILLLPLVAMQFTDEVNWQLKDFIIAGGLLMGTGLTFVLIMRKTRIVGSITYRAAIGVALATTLTLIWVIGAVGLIGAEGDTFDLMYGAVLAVGIIGAILARFQPRAMAHALFATAFTQGMVTFITLTIIGHYTVIGSFGWILLSNGLFVMLWIGSALLFLHASSAGSQKMTK